MRLPHLLRHSIHYQSNARNRQEDSQRSRLSLARKVHEKLFQPEFGLIQSHIAETSLAGLRKGEAGLRIAGVSSQVVRKTHIQRVVVYGSGCRRVIDRGKDARQQ